MLEPDRYLIPDAIIEAVLQKMPYGTTPEQVRDALHEILKPREGNS